MFRVVTRCRVLVGFVFMLVLFVTGILLFGPLSSGNAGEFEKLMGDAVEHGTDVDAARARKDAAEASVKRAWSKFLPSISAKGAFGYNRDNQFGRLKGVGRDHYDSSEYGVSASLPLYRGGANYYGLKEARDQAAAEGYSYEEVRQMLLLDTARAILGIIRDREIVSLQRENRAIVGAILRSTQRRFEGGEATRTDIELARDQYTSAQSVYTQAIDNLHQNETEFERLIGRKAGRLSPPNKIYARLPKTLNEAISLAESQNPQLLAAGKRSSAADHALKATYSKFLPSVDLNLDYTEDRYHGLATRDESDFSVKLNFSVPLYAPEAAPAHEESRHVSRQRKFEERDARSQVRAMAAVAWRSFHTARKRYRLAEARIKAASKAAFGMRRELTAGQRTVLDVLDTQERLVEARVQSANAKYETFMSAHLLLSAVGELDVYSRQTDELSRYVSSATKKYRRDGKIKKTKTPLNTDWKLQETKLKREKKSRALGIMKAALPIVPPVEETGATGGKKVAKERRMALGRSFVKRVEVADVTLPLKKLADAPKVKIPFVAVKQKVKVRPKAIDKQGPQLKIISPVDAKDERLKPDQLRKTIYSKRQKKDDRIITGSVDGVEAKAQGRRVGGLKFHDIPLPIKKGMMRRAERRAVEPVVTASLRKIVEPTVEEYPDTYENRFAVWWNNGIDSVFDPKIFKPELFGYKNNKNIKLIPIDEYRAKRQSETP